MLPMNSFNQDFGQARKWAIVAALGATLCLNATLAAQHMDAVPATLPATQSTTLPANTFTLSEGEDKHLERQAVVALAQVEAALDANPAVVDDIPVERALALTLLDAILHEPGAPNRPAIGQFRLARTKRAIEDMRRTKVTDDGAIVWQIYNMGFVVRTKSVTLGFDLVKLTHVPAFSLDNETMKAVIDQCDVLFVSHEHLDHADREVAEWFLAAGKPVLAPNAMWLGEPLHDRLTHLPRDAASNGHALPVRGGTASLGVTIYPGFQHTKDGEDVENNVYIVTTPEGIRVGHTGDNNVPGGLPPSGSVDKPVDLLVMKLMLGKLKSKDIIAPFIPRIVLPSHFEEVGHVNVNGREPFWRGMERAPNLGVPTLIMMWGERFQYAPPAK